MKVNKFKNGYCKVKLNNKYNYINELNELANDVWFDNILYDDPEDTFLNEYRKFDCCVVRIGKKYNILNKTTKEIMSEQWFDDIDLAIVEYSSFYNNGFIVKLNGKYNIINNNGELLSNTWFDEINDNVNICYDDDFNNSISYISVKNSGKYNIFNITDRKIEFPIWFDDLVKKLIYKYAICIINGKYNIVSADNGLVFKNLEINDISEESSWTNRRKNIIVKTSSGTNLSDYNGNFILDKWYDEINYWTSFENQIMEYDRIIKACSTFPVDNNYCYIVKSNEKYNLLNHELKFLSDTWFDKIIKDHRNSTVFRVMLDGKWNYINKADGKLIFNEWYDKVGYLDSDKLFIVVKNGKINIKNIKDQYIFDTWYDDIDIFDDTYYKVTLNGLYNLIKADDGKLMFDTWYKCIIKSTDKSNNIIFGKLDKNFKIILN